MAYWNFNEGTGTVARDSSANGNTGTVVGATWTTAGHNGAALNFTSGNAHVAVPASSSLALATNRVTLACWVYPTSLTSSYVTLMQRSNTAGNWYIWQIYARAADAPTAGRPVFRINWDNNARNDSGETVQGTSNLATNQWIHIACTYDGTALRFYRNGILTASTARASGVIPTSTKPLWIGANDVWGEPFRGRIDEVRIYNRALSQAEIQALMAQ